MTISIFVADDHGIVREGICALLNKNPDFDVIGEAENGREAIKAITSLQPDIVVMDIAMPLLNGIQAAQQLSQGAPKIAIIILSMHNTSEYIFRALNAGVRGYVLKDSVGSDLEKAIHTVYVGQRYLSAKISDTLITDYLHTRTANEQASPIAQMTPRELEVLALVVEGYSSAKIGEILSLSPKTVDSYRSRVMKKLDVDNVPQLVKFAIQHGLTSL